MTAETSKKPKFDKDLLFLADEKEQLSWVVDKSDPISLLEHNIKESKRQHRREIGFHGGMMLGSYLVLEATNQIFKYLGKSRSAFDKSASLTFGKGLRMTMIGSIYGLVGMSFAYNGVQLVRKSYIEVVPLPEVETQKS